MASKFCPVCRAPKGFVGVEDCGCEIPIEEEVVQAPEVDLGPVTIEHEITYVARNRLPVVLNNPTITTDDVVQANPMTVVDGTAWYNDIRIGTVVGPTTVSAGTGINLTGGTFRFDNPNLERYDMVTPALVAPLAEQMARDADARLLRELEEAAGSGSLGTSPITREEMTEAFERIRNQPILPNSFYYHSSPPATISFGSVDGANVEVGDRVRLMAGSGPEGDGIYEVTSAGDWNQPYVPGRMTGTISASNVWLNPNWGTLADESVVDAAYDDLDNPDGVVVGLTGGTRCAVTDRIFPYYMPEIPEGWRHMYYGEEVTADCLISSEDHLDYDGDHVWDEVDIRDWSGYLYSVGTPQVFIKRENRPSTRSDSPVRPNHIELRVAL